MASMSLSISMLVAYIAFSTPAEGVEAALQLRFLHENGCDELQGYYLGRPLPAAEMEALLEKGIAHPEACG